MRPRPGLTGSFATRRCAIPWFLRTQVCANIGAISTPSSNGPARSRTKEWWSRFLRDPGGTGFWHETYLLRGGIDAIYDGIPRSLGLLAFAPARPARGAFLSARRRAHLEGAEELSPMVPDGQAR